MHRFAAVVTAGIALAIAAGVTSGSETAATPTARTDRCAPALREQFRSEADLKMAVEGFGYQVVQVGTDAGCYAVVSAASRGVAHRHAPAACPSIAIDICQEPTRGRVSTRWSSGHRSSMSIDRNQQRGAFGGNGAPG
jgi:hypothetical protein